MTNDLLRQCEEVAKESLGKETVGWSHETFLEVANDLRAARAEVERLTVERATDVAYSLDLIQQRDAARAELSTAAQILGWGEIVWKGVE